MYRHTPDCIVNTRFALTYTIVAVEVLAVAVRIRSAAARQ